MSLKTCIIKHVSRMASVDRAELTSSTQDYVERGMSQQNAEVQAIEDKLDELRALKHKITDQVVVEFKKKMPDRFEKAQKTISDESKKTKENNQLSNINKEGVAEKKDKIQDNAEAFTTKGTRLADKADTKNKSKELLLPDGGVVGNIGAASGALDDNHRYNDARHNRDNQERSSSKVNETEIKSKHYLPANNASAKGDYVATTSDLQNGEYAKNEVSEPTNDIGRQQQFELFSAPENDKRKEYADLYGTIIKAKPVAETRAATDKIQSLEGLASLMASIRKDPQESFYAVVTDKNKKILRVMQYTRGTANSSSVYPVDVVAEAASIDGANTLHLIHNHPSGIPTASAADQKITKGIFDMLDGTEIRSGRHAIVAGDNYSDGEQVGGETGKIRPRLRRVTVPITQRRMMKNKALGEPITSPASAKSMVAGYDNALFLLNIQNAPVAIITLSENEMGALRKTGSVSRVLAAINKSNARAAVIKTNNKEAAANLSKMLNSLNEINVLDWFNGENQSEAEAGSYGQAIDSQGTFYSLADESQTAAGLSKKVTQSIIDDYRRDWKNTLIDIKAVSNIDDLPSAVKAKIEKDKFSNEQVKGIYYNGKVFINASTMQNREAVEAAIKHEVFGHYGLRALLGDKNVKLALTRLYMAIGGDKGLRDLAEKNNIDLSKYEKILKSGSPSERINVMTDELLAHIAQDSRPSVKRWLQELWGAIRAWFRAQGLANMGNMTDSEIMHLLRKTREAARDVKLDGGSAVRVLLDDDIDLTGITTAIPAYALSSIPEATRKIISSDPLLAAWTLLAQNEDAFQLPTSDVKTLEGIFEELNPDIKIARAPQFDEGGAQVWKINPSRDTMGLIFVKGDSVWIDVADFEQGGGGKKVYNAVANYAYNTGKQFIGDPVGLSDVALSRRLENMISSALKFGTTKHLWPHERQETGGAGVPAIKWKDDDDNHNLLEMIRTSYEAVKNQFPEIAELTYNPTQDIFENGSTGLEYTDADFRRLSKRERAGQDAGLNNAGRARGRRSQYTAGITTLKRAVLTHSMVRGTREERFRILEKLSGQSVQSSLNKILYSVKDDSKTRSGGFLNGRSKKISFSRYESLGSTDYDISLTVKDVASIIGFDVPFTIGMNNDISAEIPMRLNLDNGVIEVNSRFKMNRADAAQYLIEEVLHGIDVVGNSKTISASSKLLEKGGIIFNEAVKHVESGGELSAFLSYPLDTSKFPDLNGDRIKAELFSRLGVIYLGEPSLLKETLPNAYRAYHNIFGIERENPISDNYVYGRVWRSSAIKPAQILQRYKSVGDARLDANGANQQEPTSRGLGGIRRAISESFSGSIFGKRISLKPNELNTFNTQKTRSGGFSVSGLQEKPIVWGISIDGILRVWQDKMRPLLRAQRAIEGGGGKITETENAYLAEEAFHGKTENDLRKMRERYLEPMAKKMAAYNIDREELDMYLWAKHAQERNEQIAKINPEMLDGGSGMTTEQANQILRQAKSEGNAARFEELSGIVYKLLDEKRKIMRQLAGDDMVDTWNSAYKFYVPLKGRAVDDSGGSFPRVGRGFDIRGKESLRALGRRTKPESPTLHSIKDTTEAIIRYRKNEVGNAFLALVEANPNPEYWEAFDATNPDFERTLLTKKGKDIVGTAKVINKEDYFITKRDGKEFYIRTEDPLLMRAMKNLGPEKMNWMVQHLAKVSRFLSSMVTSYNPEFVLTNFSRDIQTAVLNLQAEIDLHDGKAKGKQITGSMIKGVPFAMRAVYASLRNKKLEGKYAEWQKSFDDFRNDGANTGWFQLFDIEQQANELQSLINMQGDTAKGKFLRTKKAIGDFVTNINGAVESAIRLSVYKSAVDAGITRKQAASLAKNLTVNFNRKGEVGASMNALYMFFNASVQGTAAFARAMGTLNIDETGKRKLNVAQKAAVGIMLASFGLARLNREIAGDDDDDENWWDKVPGHVKERNIVIMKSLWGGKPGEYITIPLPYGYNVFNALATTADSAVNGKKGVGEASVVMLKALMGAFSPLGVAESNTIAGGAVRTIAPTAIKPLADLASNENFFGSKIFAENFEFGAQKPDSHLHLRSTNDVWVWASEFLNDATGGSPYRSGLIDVSPDKVGYIFNYFVGGAGQFYSRIVHLGIKGAQNREIEPTDIPFLRRFEGEVRPYPDQQKFYDRKEKIDQIVAERKSLDYGSAARADFEKKFSSELELSFKAKATAAELTRLRKQRNKISDDEDMSEKDKDEKLKPIEEKMKVAVDRFNKSYGVKH